MRISTALLVVCSFSGATTTREALDTLGDKDLHVLVDTGHYQEPRGAATSSYLTSSSHTVTSGNLCPISTFSITVAPQLCTDHTTIAGTAKNLTYVCPTNSATFTQSLHTIYVTVTETFTTTPIIMVTTSQSSSAVSSRGYTSVKTFGPTTTFLSTTSASIPRTERISTVEDRSTTTKTRTLKVNSSASGIFWTGVPSGCTGTGTGYRTGLIGNWTNPTPTYRAAGSTTPTLFAPGTETNVPSRHRNDAVSHDMSPMGLIISAVLAIILIIMSLPKI